MFEFLVDLLTGIGGGYLNLFLGLFLGGGVCIAIFALYSKIVDWLEERDSAHSWIAFPLVVIIISGIAWVLELVF